MVYLVETYDKKNLLSFPGAKEKTQVLQWLFFQASGQGAYCKRAPFRRQNPTDTGSTVGQAAHFKMFAPEKIPYGIERYTKEVARVCSVLNDVLSKQAFLVGDHVSIADLSFIPWVCSSLQVLKSLLTRIGVAEQLRSHGPPPGRCRPRHRVPRSYEVAHWPQRARLRQGWCR